MTIQKAGACKRYKRETCSFCGARLSKSKKENGARYCSMRCSSLMDYAAARLRKHDAEMSHQQACAIVEDLRGHKE